MCDELISFDFLESDDSSDEEGPRHQMVKRRKIRQECDPFSIEDREFIKRYRLTKDLVRNLCDELKPHMSVPKKSTDLSVETKVLVALSFYATGSYQRPIGDIGSHSISQPTVSVVIKEITALLNLPQIRAKYIKWPQSSSERRANVVKFYNKFGMPGVLGCIDCTHVAIIRPQEHEERYYCRKQYHSLNVQLYTNWIFIGINLFLGDSGYALRRYMMTPIVNTSPGSPEASYTYLHTKTRNIVERTIGLLKARFRCLLVHRVLHYSPIVAASIVNACTVLHNICVRGNVVEIPELSEEELVYEASMQQSQPHHAQGATGSARELRDGLAARSALVTRYLFSVFIIMCEELVIFDFLASNDEEPRRQMAIQRKIR
ncbi:hypothetical protein SFRURICE_003567 [Spodoptera frugiperda]|nr:hypothetical protein SFRURICE_003567 [Spodoptera frugiperda]